MSRDGGRGLCPNCNLNTSFSEVHRARVWPRYESQGAAGWSINDPATVTDLYVMECNFCSDTSVVLEARHSSTAEGGLVRKERRVVVPAKSPRELDSSVPEQVRALFQEGSVCEDAGAKRAAGVMYRAAVEQLVLAQGGSGKDLYAKIDSLKGKLGEIAEHFHEARMLGNDSIHAGLEYSAEEVADVAELIAEAALVLYVQPAERQRMRDARSVRRAAAKNGGTKA